MKRKSTSHDSRHNNYQAHVARIIQFSILAKNRKRASLSQYIECDFNLPGNLRLESKLKMSGPVKSYLVTDTLDILHP